MMLCSVIPALVAVIFLTIESSAETKTTKTVEVFERNQNIELPCGGQSKPSNSSCHLVSNIVPCAMPHLYSILSSYSSIKWTKNKLPLNTSNETLLITDLFFGDSGEYTCEICYEADCITSTTQLQVIHKLNDRYMPNQTVEPGSNVRFDCLPRILSGLNCNVSFFRVERPVLNASDLSVLTYARKLNSDNFLEIANVNEQSVGWYTCVVTKKDQSNQDVTVAYKSALLSMSGEPRNEPSNPEETTYTPTIVTLVTGGIVIVIILVFLLYRQSRIKQKYYDRWVKIVTVSTMNETDVDSNTFQMPIVKITKQRSLVVVNSSYEPTSVMEYEFPIDENWEIPRSKLTLGKQLGEGAFGKVVMAKADGLVGEGVTTPVAIKMLKDEHTDSDVKDLVCELEIMKIIGRHPNIVNLLGCCTIDGPLYVIVEFAVHGNLKDFLRSHNLATSQQVTFALQIARGMEHLSAMKLIHRDLAARNILVGEGLVMKIADFGLARDIHSYEYYRKTTSGKLPIRWMAPESLENFYFDTNSDVWSFGVLLWEIMALGRIPYASINSWESLLEYLKRGNRLEKPENCPERIYDIMRECWQFKAEERPNFNHLKTCIELLCLEKYWNFEKAPSTLPDDAEPLKNQQC